VPSPRYTPLKLLTPDCGRSLPQDDDEGLEAAERELKESPARKEKASWLPFLSPVLLKAMSLIFFAEWGDRSQIATIG
jgi:putative Ca2+/H+ antiporter (TMEM165/GDT1 family)